jgi:2-polyprenyl-3-methyl-5-hydroxy-6-metoxy-1,4-benzoquinol methylase
MTQRNLPGQISDETGFETLELFAQTDRFNSWLFETLTRDCKDNILEIGSGIGNISALLLEKYHEVTLSDLRDEYCGLLRHKFGNNPGLAGIESLDLSELRFDHKYRHLMNRFNSIIASNVIEHIQDDKLAIRNCRSMLRPKGRLAVLVPAYQALYNGFDRELGHYRRYNQKKLSAIFEEEGFGIVSAKYFNFSGIFGWWFAGSVLRKKMIPKNQLVLYNKLVPAFELTDRLLMNRIGLSVIVVGEKK